MNRDEIEWLIPVWVALRGNVSTLAEKQLYERLTDHLLGFVRQGEATQQEPSGPMQALQLWSAKRLAERITNAVFTNGSRQAAHRVLLFDANGLSLSDWSHSALRASIEQILISPLE